MKKSIGYLDDFIGKKIIRKKPTINGDFSYMDTPIKLLGFTTKGEMIYNSKDPDKVLFLPESFNDKNWILLEDLYVPKDNPLNQWLGMEIRRINPTKHNDTSFMNDHDGYPILISATKYHMVVRWNNSDMILSSEFCDPNDWELV